MAPSWVERFQATPDVAREADTLLTAFLARHPVSEALVHTIQLVVSELVTNALEHGYGGAWGGRIGVEVHLERGSVRIIVEDEGQGLDVAAEPALPEAQDATGGRGLYIVRALARDCRIETRAGGGTRIEAELEIQNSPSAEGGGTWLPSEF